MSKFTDESFILSTKKKPKYTITTSKDTDRCLKWSVRNNNFESLDMLIKSKRYNLDDVCIMAAQQGNIEILSLCLNGGTEMNNELFSAACASGNLECAQFVEEKISNIHVYDPKQTYENIDYCTALYGAIDKSRIDIVKWLMVKTISPDYRIISTILPRVKSQEMIDLIIYATPEINKKDVLLCLEKCSVEPDIENVKMNIVYRYWDRVKQILSIQGVGGQWINLEFNEKCYLLSIVIRDGQVDILEYLAKLFSEEDLKRFVIKFLCDCSDINTFRVLKSLSGNIDKYFLVRGAVKVRDIESYTELNFKDYPKACIEGAALGNNSDLMVTFLDDNHFSRYLDQPLLEKLLFYSRKLRYPSIETILLEYKR